MTEARQPRVPFAGSTRRARLPADWSAIRKQRLELDGYQCTWVLPSGTRCPERATDVDHIVEMADDHSLAGLQSLCGPHHDHKTSAFAGRASAVQRRKMIAARFRKAEPHPGLRREAP